jgi:hypothetical protein
VVAKKELNAIQVKLFEKMFLLVGRDYDPSFLGNQNWWRLSSWTAAQREDFREWAEKLLQDTGYERYKDYSKVKSAVAWFLFDYGWSEAGAED